MIEAGAHALAAEAAHAEELTALVLAAAPASSPPPRQSPGSTSPRTMPSARPKRLVPAASCRRACLDIVGGRHPVVERALADLGERFVANDLSLGASDRLWLITGPTWAASRPFSARPR